MKRRRKRRKSEPKGDYEIGYCRPPKATQFQPGQSGNPKGPGKPPRSIGAAADKALKSKVAVVDQHGRRCSVPAEDMIMRTFPDAALNGDVKAAAFLMDRADKYRSAQPETTQAPELSPQDIEILESLLGHVPRARKRKPSTRRKPPARQKPRGEEPASGVRPA
jgi:hypothetical protein